MKFVFTIFLSIIVSASVWSQDLLVKDLDGEIVTSFQKTTTKTFKIQNFSNTEKSIRIKQNIDDNQGGSTFVICYQGDCSNKNEPITITLPANSISNDFKIMLNGGLSNLNSIAYLEFIDLEVDNVVKREVVLKVTERNTKDIFFEKGDIAVNSFFPNPAVKNAVMEYNISPREEDAKITLQNVLGSIVNTYELSPEHNKLSINTEDLNPGVYFYTLSIRDEGLATRKLIVKK
jgi:hypothetical protein